MTTQTAEEFFTNDILDIFGRLVIVVAELGEIEKVAVKSVKKSGDSFIVTGSTELIDGDAPADKVGHMGDEIKRAESDEVRAANVILAQIKAMDPRAIWAWGAGGRGDLVQRTLEHDGVQLPGLCLTVRNHRAMKEGKVHIGLDVAADEYTILFYDKVSMRAGDLAPFKSVSGVYADNMISVIDHELAQKR